MKYQQKKTYDERWEHKGYRHQYRKKYTPKKTSSYKTQYAS